MKHKLIYEWVYFVVLDTDTIFMYEKDIEKDKKIIDLINIIVLVYFYTRI